MGVKGLAAYVEANGLLETIQISKTSPRNVVIDGSALSYFLYEKNFNWKVGGQYTEFSLDLEFFIKSLLSRGVKISAVVFDSMWGNTKIARFKKEKRYRERLKSVSGYWESLKEEKYMLNMYSYKAPVKPNAMFLKSDSKDFKSTYERTILPPLTHFITTETLKTLKIPVIFALAEADKIIANLAFQIKATVLGRDSDFMIYDLPNGYIRFDSFCLLKKSLKASLYRRTKLAKFMGINESWFPLLSCILGNDYVCFFSLRKMLYPYICSDYPVTMNHVILALRKLNPKYNLQEAMHAFFCNINVPKKKIHYLENTFKLALKEYEIDPHILNIYSKSYFFDPHGLLNDPFFSQTFFCSPLLEDLSLESVWNVSLLLRSMAYFKNTPFDSVYENVRKKKSFQIQSVPAIYSPYAELLNHYPSLLQRVLRFLIDTNAIQVYQLLAVVLGKAAVETYPSGQLYIIPDHTHFIALLESCIISGSMLWKIPIDLKNVVDVPRLHYFLNSLKYSSGSIRALFNDKCHLSKNSSIAYLKNILHDKHEPLIKAQKKWIFDI
ncbi:Protein asteroid 1 [Coelomomyces lativittatus]|nr:Protein asteroid 1 [Coelomomyces lativittatus]KAJ1508968.1 Protein asteroid 1 [Coelomomyces lativittatus]KAJ1512893.1 Protein asteroid 1 [Coelomomyces lativittatus]